MQFIFSIVSIFVLVIYISRYVLSYLSDAVCGKKKREKTKTLNGRLPLEDSSDFDDPVLVLIVMMRSIV